ncbi:MAG: 16S rRNA (cytidine(1402)-2'-O)-methyltransferase [Myxococcales bacterium]|nr:MAG: 16S rRNA (cytidine(1402)-2'-O)-methyltransferase [Myxococcales bacterium]
MSGVLYVIATPIGNLDDFSPRAARALAEADVILCEDTRHSKKLLDRVGAKGRPLSFHEHNERDRLPEVLQILKSGRNVALISDAGTPALSDPGFPLVRACREAGVAVVPLPGPMAAVTALMAAGLPTDRFAFLGFPPETAGKRAQALAEAALLPMTVVFYLSPHKTARQMPDLAAAFGERPAVLARELTKIYEEFIVGTVAGLAAQLTAEPPKGELVLVIQGKPEAKATDDEKQETLARFTAEGLSGRRLAKALQERLGLPRGEAYKLALSVDETAGDE